MKNFVDFIECEVFVVVIFLEEEDSCIYMSFVEDLCECYLDMVKIFEEMVEEECGYWYMLLELYE